MPESRSVLPKAKLRYTHSHYDAPARSWFPHGSSHAQGVDDDVGLQIVPHRPADDPFGIDIHYRCQKQPALPSLDIGDVGDPEFVGSIGDEVSLDQIRSCCCFGGKLLLAPLSASGYAFQPQFTHQTGNAFPADLNAVSIGQLSVDAGNAVDAERGLVNLAYHRFDLEVKAAPV